MEDSLNRLLEKEFSKNENECEKLFQKIFKQEAKKALKIYMDPFTSKGFEKVLRRLTRKPNLKKEQYIKFLTTLYQKD